MKKLATLALVLLFLVTVTAPIGAQTGRALAIEDYYKIKSVGDTQISPDGRWVVYTLTTRVEDGSAITSCNIH
jgi:hypothetical protein